MAQLRRCKDCRRDETETYVSRRYLCRDCAKRRVVQQMDVAYDLAEQMTPPVTGSLGEQISRATDYVTSLVDERTVRKAQEYVRRRGRPRKEAAPG